MSKISTRLLVYLAIITALSLFSLWLSTKTNLVKAASPSQADSVQAVDQTSSGIENPVTDLVIDSMEVTQSVQDLNNSVPLVMGRRTFIRVYAHSTNGTYPTTAVLRVKAGGFNLALLPIPPGGPSINVRPTYNRLMSSHAFLFELPTYTTFFSPLTLTAEINPVLFWHMRSPEEYSYSNNSITKTFTFNEIPPLYLVIASQPYTINNIKFSPTIYDMWSMTDWIQRAYPVSQVKVFLRTMPTLTGQRAKNKYNNWDLVYPNCSILNSYMAFRRASILGNPFYPDDLALYAMVADTAAFMRGCAPIGGYYFNTYTRARVASGPSGSEDFGWDYDGTYADWYGGHELGHSFNQAHVKGGPGYVEDGCGGEAGNNSQFPDGRISPTINYFSPKAVFGFDYRQLYAHGNPILGPNWHDMMTYCDYQWISSATYTFMQVIFKYNLPLEQPIRPEQPSIQDVLAIFGAIDLTTGQLELQPTSILYSVPDVVLPPPGDYAIILLDADGGELERYSFSPHGSEQGQSPDPTQEGRYVYLSELVPYVPGTVTVQVTGPSGNVLAEINAGIDPPSVQVTSPTRGTIGDGDTITVTWTASDPNNDPLTFNIDYSSDDGATWDTAGIFLTGSQAIIDASNFPASNSARVRVWASDGIHTVRSTSDPFTIPNHLPFGEIILPSSDTTIAVSQTVTFEGQVYDIDIGNLDGTNIQWSSNLDGFIGNGATFNTDSLSIGTHLITMTAGDGQGGVISDQVWVTVVPTPNDLPVQPDALSVGPDPVFLEPSSGIITATIYVDNLNLGNPINWSVSADQPWVQLSTESGTTPGELTISADLSQVSFGTYTALITFTSPQAPREVSIRAVLNIPQYRLFLPLTLK